MSGKQKNKQFEGGLDQYKIPGALIQPRDYNYRVGYEASSGNRTASDHEFGKKG